MNALRRTLYLQAAVWGVAGAALAVAPGFVLKSVFGQPGLNEPTWLRVTGIEGFALAMLMVLVGHRADDLWWWSWAFAFLSTALAGAALLNAAFGLNPGQSGALWWALGAVAAAFSAALLAGLYLTSRERPLP